MTCDVMPDTRHCFAHGRDVMMCLCEIEAERDRLRKDHEETAERWTNALAERDRYKADWERLMAAIGPYSTTDIAVKMAESARERENRHRKALEEIVTIYRNDYNNPDLCRDMADIATKALKGQC